MSGRLISDMSKLCHIEKLSGYLMTIGFEKAFDSMNYASLELLLKNMVWWQFHRLD